MAEETDKTPFEAIVDLFVERGVEFIVIDGQAESLFGSPRVTYDVDLCYRRTRDNLVRLASALKELKPTLRNAPPDLPFQLDADSLALGTNFTFCTTAGDLDLIGYVEPLGEYDSLAKNAEVLPFGPYDLKVIALDDLIRVKQHINRPKDRDSLMQLLAIKRLREEADESR